MNTLTTVHTVNTAGAMDIVMAVLLVFMNAMAYIRMGVDKRRAKTGRWRVSENELLLWCACFGAFGGLMGMRRFRHKTRHRKFIILPPLFLVLQIGLLAVYLFGRG